MSTVNDFHPKAMDLADMAFAHRRRGDEERAKQLFLEALQLEQQAALLLPPKIESEPSRSVLCRSAASLAYNGGDYEIADWLIANGLAGFPPPEIKVELKDLYDDVNFMRHLSAKGVELSNEQLLMTISGNATSHGSAPADHLMLRVDRFSKMFYRTVERLLKLPYRISGGVSKDLKDLYVLYVSALLPGSFAVNFQIGRPNPQMVLWPELEPRKLVDPELVIDEVHKCFEILESIEPESLRERFDDLDYYENFIGLAKQMAPDGNDIKLVGLTTIRGGKERSVALRKTRQQLRETPGLSATLDKDEEKVRASYTGILKYASSPSKGKLGTVRLIDAETGIRHKIKVPISLMKDVVQPFYEERVNILVYLRSGEKCLEEINLDA